MSQIQGAEIPNTPELESIVTSTGRDALGNCPLRESVRGCPCGPCGPCGPTTRTTFSSASLPPNYGGQPPPPVTTVLATYILRPSSPPVISTAQLLPPFTLIPLYLFPGPWAANVILRKIVHQTTHGVYTSRHIHPINTIPVQC